MPSSPTSSLPPPESALPDRDLRLLWAQDRAQRELFSQRLIDALPGIFYMFDSQGRFLSWNDNFEAVSGYSGEEIRHMHPIDFFRGTDRELIAARIGLTFEEGSADAEANFVAKDGTATPYYFTGRFMALEGRPCLLGVGIDISARIRAEERQRHLELQLRQTQRLESIGRLAAGIAHDFNNILTVQQAYLALLQEGVELSEGSLSHIRQISVAAERAAALTRQLLLFSRRQTLQVRTVQLGDIVSQLGNMLRRILGEDVTLEVEVPTRALPIRADAGMVEQVLMNLAVNARDAMSHGGRLRIVLDEVETVSRAEGAPREGEPQGFARIVVEDNGVGIPEAVQPHVFEPFFTTKPAGEGTGLGLSTAYGIVQQHQGWIELSSREGEGTSFRIFFPLALRESWAPRSVRFPRPHAGGGETLLLVEDEVTLRSVLKGILEQQGYRVLEAGSGPAAIEVWSEERAAISLLITDMVMPGGMSGSEIAARLREDAPELPVIMTSGYTTEPLDGLEACPMTAFLHKPYQPARLQELVRSLLDGAPLTAC